MSIDTRTLSVSLGGLEFRPLYALPPAGQWYAEVADLTGWWEPARDGTDTTPHWSGQGQITGVPQLEARQLTLEGSLIGSTVEGIGSAHQALEQFRRLRRTTLRVAELDVVREADVRIVQLQASRVGPWEVAVTVSMVADDPLLYSSESRYITGNGLLKLANRGNTWAAGRLALVGPHNPITISHFDGVWSFPVLGAGAARLIDFREQVVWNGNARQFGVGAGPWPRVGPGGATWVIAGLGSGSAILSRTEAWT